jgi:hypothetical protein
MLANIWHRQAYCADICVMKRSHGFNFRRESAGRNAGVGILAETGFKMVNQGAR